jgi:hypothetical protein
MGAMQGTTVGRGQKEKDGSRLTSKKDGGLRVADIEGMAGDEEA